MKKLILSSLIVTMLFFGGTANAGMVITASLGVPVGAAFVTTLMVSSGVVGLGFAYFLKDTKGGMFGAAMVMFGFALLDENHQVVEFEPIDPSNASKLRKHGITKKEAIVYNEDLSRINLTYDEFSKRYNKEMTQEQATAAYNEVATDVGLSSGARDVLSKVIVHAASLIMEKQSK